MISPETSREPCLDRVINDAGTGFNVGIYSGTVYHLIRGLTNSPRGEKLSGAIKSVRINVPRTAGRFGVFLALFSTFESGMFYLRRKDNPWNSITAVAATCGLLQLRRGVGVGAVARSASAGAALMALMEGAVIFGERFCSSMPPKETMDGAAGGENKEETSFDSLSFYYKYYKLRGNQGYPRRLMGSAQQFWTQNVYGNSDSDSESD